MNVFNFLKPVLLITVIVAIEALFLIFPAPSDRIINIQDYLITTGGIISAVVITYLSTKVFSLKSERGYTQEKIDKLAAKLTLFRRLLHYIMVSDGFWVRHEDIEIFKRKYAGLGYHELKDHENELANYFHLDEKQISQTTIDIYMAMECISGPARVPGVILTWHQDPSKTFRYTLEDLSNYYEPCNQIWYYLDYKFHKHSAHLINDTAIWPGYRDSAMELIGRIDKKYKGQEINRHIISEISANFYTFYIPTLYKLTKGNLGIPSALMKLFYALLFITCVSVIAPLILVSINIPSGLNTFLTLSLVWLTTIGLIVFINQFFHFLNDDVHLKN